MYLIKQVKVIIEILMRKDVTFFEKTIMLLMIIYIISPIDLIPFPVFGFNVIDDIIVFILLVSYTNKVAIKYEKYDKLNVDSDKVINNVEYEINEEFNSGENYKNE